MTHADGAVLKTTAGSIKGARQNGLYVFRGIPYAAAARMFSPGMSTPQLGHGVLTPLWFRQQEFESEC